MDFASFNLRKDLTEALIKIGFKECTDVQEKVIPKVLNGKNALVQAETGSGKTHAFLVPLINKISNNNPYPQSIIVAPTRELAKQIYDFANEISRKFNFSIKLFISGTDNEREIEKAKTGAQMIIGTPGKIASLISKHAFAFDSVSSIVIDEADMTLEMGYFEDVNKIISTVNPKQILVFSATYSNDLMSAVRKYIKADSVLLSKSSNKEENIKHFAIDKKHIDLNEALLIFIKAKRPYFLLVFCSKIETVKKVYDYLNNQGIKTGIIHGKLESRERKSMMRRIKAMEYSVVVCSDMAARGIDIDGVSTVLNYDMPQDLSYYFHRAGRTGRYKSKGECYSFYNADSTTYIEKLKDSGVNFEYYVIKNDQLIESRNLSKKKKKKINTELDKQIKIETAKVRTKKVKPNYKKKVRLAAEKVKRKHRREMIKKDIRKQREQRYREEARNAR